MDKTTNAHQMYYQWLYIKVAAPLRPTRRYEIYTKKKSKKFDTNKLMSTRAWYLVPESGDEAWHGERFTPLMKRDDSGRIDCYLKGKSFGDAKNNIFSRVGRSLRLYEFQKGLFSAIIRAKPKLPRGRCPLWATSVVFRGIFEFRTLRNLRVAKRVRNVIIFYINNF